MRRKENPQDDKRYQAAQDRIARLEKRVGRYDDLIEAAMARHQPAFNLAGDGLPWDLKPGNLGSDMAFYCADCRRPWPCSEFNNLRAIYGEAHEWSPATTPYEPLRLRKAKPPTHTPPRTEPGDERSA